MATIPAADPSRLPPDSLGVQGRRVWNMVTRLEDDGTPVYVLRPDDMMNLERWCKAEDMVVDLEAGLAVHAGARGDRPRDFWMPGIQGTMTVNGLLSELRQWNAAAAAASKALKLPDLDAGSEGVKTQRQHQAEAVAARWHGSGTG